MTLRDTSVFAANSPQAQAIARLFYFDLALTAAVFLTVALLVFYAVARFRQRPGAREPSQDEGNPKLEVMWTVVPGLVLTALFIATAHAMSIINPPVRERQPDVLVVAHQWWWEYHYPKSGVLTANELHLPAATRLLIKLESADVIHDFWVPDLGAKMDAIPGHPNYLWLTPLRPGTYLGTCAEFCGSEHALMGIRVIIEPPDAFAAWERLQTQVSEKPTQGPAATGAQLFQEKTCQSCHAIAGSEAAGKVGPDLSHVGSRQTLAAGVLANDLDNLTRWILWPQRYKPKCHMPNLRLAEGEARAIALYLEGQR